MQRTPVANKDDALDIIEHVNEDHSKELKAIVQASSLGREVTRAELVELYEEGALVGIYESDGSESEKLFVPFQIKGTLEEKLFHLAYAYSDPEQSQKDTKRFLTVTDSLSLTSNFTRITVRSEKPFPSNWAGLCFSVHLKVLEKTFEEPRESTWRERLFARAYQSISLTLMRFLPVSMRRSMVKNSRKGLRAYTLRKQWQEQRDGETQFFGALDIFTHGSSPGSVWTNQLKAGDIVFTSGDHPDKHPALAEGRNVIFCDETAYPAAAGILENWQNPISPTLIIVSQQASEQDYFEDVALPTDTEVHRIVCHYKYQGEMVIGVLKTLEHVDTVWGAMEMITAKQVRHFLRNTHKLKGTNNLVKPYWRSDQEKA